LFVTLNLNLLFDHIENLEENVAQVFSGVNQVLDRSQDSHYQKFMIMLESCKEVKNHINIIKKERSDIKTVISKYENLIDRTIKTEKIITDRLSNLRRPDGFNNEMDILSEKNKLEMKWRQLEDIKGKAMEKLAVLRDKDSNISLRVDKILFDNIIMMNNITNNLKGLERK
jgi:Trk K+ transport system NAD-binding subunit